MPPGADQALPEAPAFSQRAHHPREHDGRTKAIARKGSVEGFEPPDKSRLRATDGKKDISMVMSSKELVSFELCAHSLRASMDRLREWDQKSKSRKKQSSTVKGPASTR